MRTWHCEMMIVTAVLVTVALLTGGGATEFIGVGAVLMSFAHVQVSDRLQAAEAARPDPSVECHAWSDRYLVSKEILWMTYFILLGAWSAIAGVGLFLLYPFWRKWWTR